VYAGDLGENSEENHEENEAEISPNGASAAPMHESLPLADMISASDKAQQQSPGRALVLDEAQQQSIGRASASGHVPGAGSEWDLAETSGAIMYSHASDAPGSRTSSRADTEIGGHAPGLDRLHQYQGAESGSSM
jgi:hypothetical protein